MENEGEWEAIAKRMITELRADLGFLLTDEDLWPDTEIFVEPALREMIQNRASWAVEDAVTEDLREITGEESIMCRVDILIGNHPAGYGGIWFIATGTSKEKTLRAKERMLAAGYVRVARPGMGSGHMAVTPEVWDRIARRRAGQQDDDALRTEVQQAIEEKNRPLPEPPSIIDILGS